MPASPSTARAGHMDNSMFTSAAPPAPAQASSPRLATSHSFCPERATGLGAPMPLSNRPSSMPHGTASRCGLIRETRADGESSTATTSPVPRRQSTPLPPLALENDRRKSRTDAMDRSVAFVLEVVDDVGQPAPVAAWLSPRSSKDWSDSSSSWMQRRKAVRVRNHRGPEHLATYALGGHSPCRPTVWRIYHRRIVYPVAPELHPPKDGRRACCRLSRYLCCKAAH